MRDATLDRLTVLDGMRGCAILLVIWYHLWLVSGYGIPFLGALEMFARNGFLGVDLFFFVSGFCIAYPYARTRCGGRAAPDAADFARRRFWKIVPSYVLAVGVFAVAYHTRFEGNLQEVTHVLAHLAFVHIWSRDMYSSLSGPLWTLGIEVQFYVVFAFVAPYVVRSPLRLYAVFLAVAAAYRLGLVFTGLDTDFLWLNQLPAVLDIFGAGMLTAVALVRPPGTAALLRPDVATRAAIAAFGVLLLGFVAVDAAARAGGDDGMHRWLNAWRVTFGPILGVLTLGLALGSAAARRIAGARVLGWLSIVSYNAYLWNLEIAVTLRDANAPAWLTFWLGAVVTLAVAALLTYRFERPLSQRGAQAARALFTRVPALARVIPRTRDRPAAERG